MRSKLPAIFLALLIATTASGTAQSPDRLILDGETYYLNTNPLDSFFEKHPDKHPRASDEDNTVVLSTGLWRGYIATFEVRENRLFVSNFEVYRYSDDRDERPTMVSETDRFFPTPESRRMEWYTGILVLPTGELKHYVHLNYASIYESYKLLRVENGLVTDSAEMTADEFVQFKRQQFAVYRESVEYQDAVNELRDPMDEQQELDDFIFSYGEFVETTMLDFDEAN